MSPEFIGAIEGARAAANAGLLAHPHDAICTYALQQLALIDTALNTDLGLAALAPGTINLGMMAVKELGNDDAAFAHALHIIQSAVDEATGLQRPWFWR
jgi:hypothetical protein